MDLCSDNSDVAYWHILISSLPLLCPYTPRDQLVIMANDIVAALYQNVGEPPASSLTVEGVLRDFMSTNTFQEMTLLHDALLACSITYEQESFPKWYTFTCYNMQL